MGRWQRYRFADGGRYAAAILRIAIAVAILMTLQSLYESYRFQVAYDASVYRPVGVWMLVGHRPPSVDVIRALYAIGWTATVAMLFGAWSRLACAVSAAACVALVALSASGSEAWSHQYNLPLVAELAFLGARGGHAPLTDAR